MKRKIPRLDKSDIEDYNVAIQCRIRLLCAFNKISNYPDIKGEDNRLIKHGLITKNKSLTKKGRALWEFINVETQSSDAFATKEGSVILEEKERMVVRYLLKKYRTVSLQVKEFKEMTRKSRTTYYRIKRGIKGQKRRTWANNVGITGIDNDE